MGLVIKVNLGTLGLRFEDTACLITLSNRLNQRLRDVPLLLLLLLL